MQSETSNRSSNTIRDIKQYIEDHLQDELSLQSVAEKVKWNPSYLSKVFKEETGTNFVDFVNTKRIESARNLILQTDFSIEEISKRVGFNSSTYFIKKFKEICGMTPRNYKMQHLQEWRKTGSEK